LKLNDCFNNITISILAWIQSVAIFCFVITTVYVSSLYIIRITIAVISYSLFVIVNSAL